MEEPDCIEFHLVACLQEVMHGYSPKGDDIANVGLGVLTTITDKTAYQHLLEFVKSNPATKKRTTSGIKYWWRPLGGLLKKRLQIMFW